jgi:DNA-binding transcriptional LysR family regulator
LTTRSTLWSSACSELLRRACRIAGFEPRIAYESDDYAAVQGLIAAGAAAALVPELALGNVRSGIAIRSLGPHTPLRRVRAAVLAEELRSPAAAAMLGILIEAGGAFIPTAMAELTI